MHTKSLPSYLTPLQQYPEILNTLESLPAERIRGTLLRILDTEIKREKEQQQCTNPISTLIYSFFKPTITYSLLVNDLMKALQELAMHYPLEDVDPIDRTPIGDAPCFISLTGRKYKLSTLTSWIQVREDFILPDNTPMYPCEIETLTELCKKYHFSLKKEPISSTLSIHLTEENISSDVVEQFHKNHVNTIKMLQKEGFNLSDITQEIRGLNIDQSEALHELFTKGLRGCHLRSLDAVEFGPHHTVALKILINEHEYSVENAIDKISDLDFDTVQNIYSIPNPNLGKI